MKQNLLDEKINEIQKEYRNLLKTLLQDAGEHKLEAILDEINIFWFRNRNVVKLYLNYIFAEKQGYVFTASTYMDYEDKEYYPFLMMGDQHILDDPLSKYSEVCVKFAEGDIPPALYEQLVLSMKDDLIILEKLNPYILILPITLFTEVEKDELENSAISIFLQLFNGIDSMKQYFQRCKTIQDLSSYLKDEYKDAIIFGENENIAIPFEERVKSSVLEMKEKLSIEDTEGIIFYMLIFGNIKQALSLLIGCMEYRCTPYVRYSVPVYYMTLLSDVLKQDDCLKNMCFRMNVGYIVHHCFDKHKARRLKFDNHLNEIIQYNFSGKLFRRLSENGVDKETYIFNNIGKIIDDELIKFYKSIEENIV